MPFKIVQTREKRGTLLTVVPGLWESNGILKWPASGTIKSSAFKELLRDENNIPDPKWVPVKCYLKRECPTYEEAVRESSKMSDMSDTDTDSTLPEEKLPAKRQVKNREIIGRSTSINFDNVVSHFLILNLLNVSAEMQ